jgi:hypothetical protein
MTHVWVVEQGRYSDYHVVGIYTTCAGAETVAAAINAAESAHDRADVAQWPLNPGLDDLNAGRTRHLVHMRYDGTVERAEPVDCATAISVDVDVWRRSQVPFYRRQGIEDIIVATVWATDAPHAIKITNEHRAQLMASGQFKPPEAQP